MKKQVYKLGLVAILGLGVLVNAQVGINEESPKATLDVRVSTANTNGTTNEGIIAPKLTKERVANIATPVEGTLVYVEDATYTGNKTEVAKIDDKGYYYFDGKVWVKAKGEAAQAVGATNGLTKDGNNISLGGTLAKATNIDQAGNNLTTSGDGNVGIGVNNPTAKLEVEGVVKSNYAVKISRNESDAGPYLQLENPLKTTDGSVKQWRIYNMTGVYPNSLQFWAYNDDQNLGTRMMLTDAGNLGIGTPSREEPTAKLDVNGNVRIRTIAEGDTSKDRVLLADTEGNVKSTSIESISSGATLNTITGKYEVVPHITRDKWTADAFGFVQTGNDAIQLPDPANYIGKIISVNNQYTNTVNYDPTNQPLNMAVIYSGNGHILMAIEKDGKAIWIVIAGA